MAAPNWQVIPRDILPHPLLGTHNAKRRDARCSAAPLRGTRGQAPTGLWQPTHSQQPFCFSQVLLCFLSGWAKYISQLSLEEEFLCMLPWLSRHCNVLLICLMHEPAWALQSQSIKSLFHWLPNALCGLKTAAAEEELEIYLGFSTVTQGDFTGRIAGQEES